MPKAEDAHWRELDRLLDQAKSLVTQVAAARVSSSEPREAAKQLVQHYFRSVRGELTNLRIDPSGLEAMDDYMQELLRLANGQGNKSAYMKAFKGARATRARLESDREMRLGQRISLVQVEQVALTGVEQSIHDALERLIPSAALSYRQALADLADRDRISFRGTANELREAFREVLDHLAPDEDVIEAAGFEFEKGQTRPTQRQRVRYILAAGGSSKTSQKVPEETSSLVEGLIASLARSTYERTSLSAHVSSARREVQQLKMYVDSVLAELLDIHKSEPSQSS